MWKYAGNGECAPGVPARCLWTPAPRLRGDVLRGKEESLSGSEESFGGKEEIDRGLTLAQAAGRRARYII